MSSRIFKRLATDIEAKFDFLAIAISGNKYRACVHKLILPVGKHAQVVLFAIGYLYGRHARWTSGEISLPPVLQNAGRMKQVQPSP
jgi:hypothetical protein